MHPALAALLAKFAEEAGKTVGRELADRIVDLLFGHLATKDDLSRAVDEIKRYIDQAVEVLIEAEFQATLENVRISLLSFSDGHREDAVDRAVAKSEEALSWLGPRSGILVGTISESSVLPPASGRFLCHFLAVATSHVASLAARSAYHPKEGSFAELRGWIIKYRSLFQAMIATIENYEREQVIEPVSLIKHSTRVRNGGPDDSGIEVRTYTCRASVVIASVRGNRTLEGKTFLSEDDGGAYCERMAREEAVSMLTTARAQVIVRANERETQIYAPIRRFIENAEKLIESINSQSVVVHLTFRELELA